MSGLNRVILTGNLTRDPLLSHTGGGTAVCELGLAVNGREKVDGEWQDRADFFDIRVFGNQAEACAEFLSKGSPVGVDGRLRLDQWVDRDTDQKRYRVRIIADNVQFLPSKKDAQQQGGGQARSTDGGDEFGVADDDIPF